MARTKSPFSRLVRPKLKSMHAISSSFGLEEWRIMSKSRSALAYSPMSNSKLPNIRVIFISTILFFWYSKYSAARAAPWSVACARMSHNWSDSLNWQASSWNEAPQTREIVSSSIVSRRSSSHQYRPELPLLREMLNIPERLQWLFYERSSSPLDIRKELALHSPV